MAPITAATAPSKTYSDLTPPIVEYELLLFATLSPVLSVHFGVSVLDLSSPKDFKFISYK